MKIVCISDLHGHLIDIPKADLVLCAGDIVPLDIQTDIRASLQWMDKVFLPWKRWIEQTSKVISIFGNHDFFGEIYPFKEEGFLCDESVTFNGLKIYGTPFQQYFRNWAFNLDDEALEVKYNQIPTDTDILLVHNPPFGILDKVETVVGGVEKVEHCGSIVLKERLNDLNLKAAIFGHIHPGWGPLTINKTIFINCSICDDRYIPSNSPILLEITC